MQSFPPVNARLLAALTTVSAAVTAQQIVLLQVLGWTHWHHFAYLVVAVALLGFGIAGTVLTLARDALFRHGSGAISWLLIVAAVSMALGVRLAQTHVLSVDLPLVFFSPVNAWRMLALCALLLPPFLAGGLVTGILLAYHAANPGRLYAASLAGAGLGGLLGLALAAQIEPPRLAPAVGGVAMIAVMFRWSDTSRFQRIAALVGGLAVAGLWIWPGQLASSQFKPLTRVLEMPEARIVGARPSLRGWVQIVAAPALRPAPAVSLNFTGAIPPHPAVFVNGLPYGSLPATKAMDGAGWLDYTTDAAAFALGERRRVLLLENGPGGWSTLAARHGADDIIVVEPNGALVELLTAGAKPFAPEWRSREVTVVVDEGRDHLARGEVAFDVIRFPTIGALGGTAGLGSASEQFLFTREAFVEALGRLSTDGVLTITAWMDFPERNPLRLLATLVEAIKARGLPPRAHIAAIRSWAAVTFLVRRSPWDARATAALLEFCEDRGFDVLLAPGVGPTSRQEFHAWQNASFFDTVDALMDGPAGRIYRAYPFLLRPATDQRPYFSQFVRLSHLWRLGEVFGTRAMPFFELGSLVIALTFGLLSVLAVACIVLPLARRGWNVPGKTSVLLYFGGLGAGYMAVEIGAMLQAHAWLGSPIEAAAVVITMLLLSSGMGSLWSERLPADRQTQRRLLLGIAGSVLLAGFLLGAGAAWGRSLPSFARVGLMLALVAVPGFAMGIAFPLGLRRLSGLRPEHVPWAWAINGCVSVATPAGATLLAMSAGFSAVFGAAAVAYLVAFIGSAIAGRWESPGQHRDD